MRLALIGPPGAGKGTQARLLGECLGVPQIASGDLLRQAVRDRTALGLRARDYMDRGALVPNELVVGLISEHLELDNAGSNFILDGFPRNLAQAEALDRMLAEKKAGRLESVVAIIVPDEEIVKRVSGRRTCQNCGAMYHIIFDPPRNLNLCNACNGELYQREDDAEDTVRMRLQVYAGSTRPLLEYYERQGILAKVDGVGAIDDVKGRILAALGRLNVATQAKAKGGAASLGRSPTGRPE